MAKKNTETTRRSVGGRARSATGEVKARLDPTHNEIAEAAYHRYLGRGGEHGRDFDDWVEAERELSRRQR